MERAWGLAEVLVGQGLEEGVRLAYMASGLMPASLVVGSAAVLAGLLGAAALKRVRASRSPGMPAPTESALWMLSAAIVAMGLGAVPASAEVLCRKGDSMRLVLRAERCRPRERVVEPSELGVGPGETCIEAIDRVWRDIAVLRAQLEGTRDFAERLAAQPWEGGEIWLALQGLALADTLGRLAEHLEVLGAVETRAVVAQL